jgi:hypothetical protein
VFNRLKAGQRSAYSEFVVGEALRALGYAFHFEAGDGQPDLVGTTGGQPVAFEVYAPDDSFASQQQSSLVQDLRNAISDAIGSSRVELEIRDLFDKTESRPQLRRFVRQRRCDGFLLKAGPCSGAPMRERCWRLISMGTVLKCASPETRIGKEPARALSFDGRPSTCFDLVIYLRKSQ